MSKNFKPSPIVTAPVNFSPPTTTNGKRIGSPSAAMEVKNVKDAAALEAKANRWKVLWRLIKFAQPEYLKIALGLVGLSINAVTNLSFPWLIGKALDQASVEDLSSFLLNNAYFFLGGTLASWLRIYCLGSAAESIANRLRIQVFDSYLQQDIHFYESLEMGEVATLLENDVNVSSELLTEKLGGFLRSLNSSINGSIALYATSPELCKITLTIVPVVGIAAMTLSRYSRQLANKFRDQQSKILSYSIERIRSVSTVRLNHKEEYEHDKFSSLLNNANSLALQRFNAHGGFMSFVNLFTNMSLIAVLRTGGALVSQGQLSVGSLTSFAIQSGFVGLGFSGLSSFYSDVIKGIDATSRLFTIIDLQMQDVEHKPLSQYQRLQRTRSSSNPTTPRSMRASFSSPASAGLAIDANSSNSISTNNNHNHSFSSPSSSLLQGIKLRNVSFAYTSRQTANILSNVSLHFKRHAITVVVGRSGSGKSTLAALLCGLYRPTAGTVSFFDEILLTSNEHEQYDAQEQNERQCVIFDWCGVVEQSGSTLWAGSIRDNIAYGYNHQSMSNEADDGDHKPSVAAGSVGGSFLQTVPQEDIERAAKAANAHEFIMSLPHGYDTEVGPGGCLLSGGQRARIALARALVKTPTYLVLDEPTSALDAQSEKEIMEPLKELKQSTTIVIFTHSEAMKSIADAVYRLEDGVLIHEN